MAIHELLVFVQAWKDGPTRTAEGFLSKAARVVLFGREFVKQKNSAIKPLPPTRVTDDLAFRLIRLHSEKRSSVHGSAVCEYPRVSQYPRSGRSMNTISRRNLALFHA